MTDKTEQGRSRGLIGGAGAIVAVPSGLPAISARRG